MELQITKDDESVVFSTLNAEIIQAYRETEFCVYGDQPMILHVGVPCEPLQETYKRYGVSSCAFLTSWNPCSQSLTSEENHRRQQKLFALLESQGFAFFKGIGQHPSNEWPGEESYLILDISLEAAKNLGNRFEQNAIVWSGSDAAPKLILLR